MKKKKNNIWLIAIIGVIAGFLMGLWAGSQFLPRLQEPQLSDLSGEQQDRYVGLVAMSYASTGDFDAAVKQLNDLNVPNLELMVSGVLERAAQLGQSPRQLAALAQLALDLGAPRTALSQYLPTPTPLPTPTFTPTMAPAATQPPAQSAAPTATPVLAAAAPTATTPPTATSTSTPLPTYTPEPRPMVAAGKQINVRGGPGVNYPVVGAMSNGEDALIVGKNPAGDWWQIELSNGILGWVYDAIVSLKGDAAGVPVASDIPAPPPTSVPAAPPTATTPPQPAGPDFRLARHHLLTVQENEGFLDGSSVHCGGKHVLRVTVVDAAGNPLNGVTVRSLYTNEEHVTGEKGPGMVEFNLYPPGNGVHIVRDVDGRDVSSDRAEAPTVEQNIPVSDLIAGGYCADAQDCAQKIANNALCHGHYSWDVVFQRSY